MVRGNQKPEFLWPTTDQKEAKQRGDGRIKAGQPVPLHQLCPSLFAFLRLQRGEIHGVPWQRDIGRHDLHRAIQAFGAG